MCAFCPGAMQEATLNKTPSAIFESEDEVSHSSSSSYSGPPPPPEIVGRRFLVEEKLGQGSYSVVHKGIDRETGAKVAIKLEWVNAEKGKRLMAEARLYQSLGDSRDVPAYRWHGREGAYNVLVMERQGSSLDDKFTACGRQFSLKTTAMLAEQMIDRIEYLHSRGVLHRDIKPHNFLMGRGEACNQVFVMDFGLSKEWVDRRSGQHVPCSERHGVTGTVRYSSLNVHEGQSPSRRDDLEALGYVLLHFLKGKLPWQGLQATKERRKKHDMIRRVKVEVGTRGLCEGYPAQFADYLDHCRSLEYASRPDYPYLRGLMEEVFREAGFQRDWAWDWSAKEKTRRMDGQRRDDRSSDKARVAVPGCVDENEVEPKRQNNCLNVPFHSRPRSADQRKAPSPSRRHASPGSAPRERRRPSVIAPTWADRAFAGDAQASRRLYVLPERQLLQQSPRGGAGPAPDARGGSAADRRDGSRRC